MQNSELPIDPKGHDLKVYDWRLFLVFLAGLLAIFGWDAYSYRDLSAVPIGVLAAAAGICAYLWMRRHAGDSTKVGNFFLIVFVLYLLITYLPRFIW